MKEITALMLGEKIKNKEVKVTEVLEWVFDQIEKKEPLYHCYISLNKEDAFAKAKVVQKGIEEGKLTHPLAGVPVAVKDNLCTKGLRTTCGSKMLRDFVPGYSATAVERMENVGAILIGKTNMDEFGMGSTTETSYFGVTENPWNETKTPGGSSGGSAAAVAAGECFLALGTDTGGSVRQPAAHCGVVGMKPTYGMVSRYGLIAYASSFDQVGVIGKNVADTTVLLTTIAGADRKDVTAVGNPDVPLEAGLIRDVEGIRVAVLIDETATAMDPAQKEAVQKAALLLRERGAIVENIELSMLKYAVPVYYIIADAEASSNLERYDGVKYGYRKEGFSDLNELYEKSRGEGFGEEVKRRIMLGTFALSAGYYDAYYHKAQQGRRLIRKELDEILERYDVILSPVTPKGASAIGESLSQPLQMYREDVYTILANLAGMPAISLPFGQDESGMPVGVQLMTGCFRDAALIQVAYSLEKFREDAKL